MAHLYSIAHSRIFIKRDTRRLLTPPRTPEPPSVPRLGGASSMSICTDSTRHRSATTANLLALFFWLPDIAGHGSPVGEPNDPGKSPLCLSGQVVR